MNEEDKKKLQEYINSLNIKHSETPQLKQGLSRNVQEGINSSVKEKQLGENLKSASFLLKDIASAGLSALWPVGGVLLGLGNASVSTLQGDPVTGTIQAGAEALPYGLGKAVKPIMKITDKATKIVEPYILARSINKNIKNTNLEKEPLLNIGWAPKQTIKVTHAKDTPKLPTLYYPKRWDAVNENAPTVGIWYQGKLGIPRTAESLGVVDAFNPNSKNLLKKADKAERARELFANREYEISGDLNLDKAIQTIGDVKNRSALEKFADKAGADAVIFNDVYDNGFDHNQVIWSLKNLDNAKINKRLEYPSTEYFIPFFNPKIEKIIKAPDKKIIQEKMDKIINERYTKLVDKKGNLSDNLKSRLKKLDINYIHKINDDLAESIGFMDDNITDNIERSEIQEILYDHLKNKSEALGAYGGNNILIRYTEPESGMYLNEKTILNNFSHEYNHALQDAVFPSLAQFDESLNYHVINPAAGKAGKAFSKYLKGEGNEGKYKIWSKSPLEVSSELSAFRRNNNIPIDKKLTEFEASEFIRKSPFFKQFKYSQNLPKDLVKVIRYLPGMSIPIVLNFNSK